MAASRSMLEALLARVQQRAREPRAQAIDIPPLPVPQVGEQESADTLPPRAAAAQGAAQSAIATEPPASNSPSIQTSSAYPSDVPGDDEDIEEYDEELIEIIDDADVIPQAAAAARAIEPSAFQASLERRGAVVNGKSSMPAAAPGAPPATGSVSPQPAAPQPAPRAGTAPPAAAAQPAAAQPASAEPLRPEAVAGRPLAPSPVVHTRGVRRELRATPFLELLDAALKLGS